MISGLSSGKDRSVVPRGEELGSEYTSFTLLVLYSANVAATIPTRKWEFNVWFVWFKSGGLKALSGSS